MWQVLSGLDYNDTIQSLQKVKEFTGSMEDVYDSLNDKSKGQTNPSERG